VPLLPNLEEMRRSHILDSAMKALAESGSNNVTMEDIARSTGLSKGGLAHYYRSKNELFMAVFSEFFSRIFERSRRRIDELSNPLEKLLSFDWLYDANDPDCRVGYPLLFDCMSMAAHDPAYRQLFQEWVNNWICLLADVIKDGISCGAFPAMDAQRSAMAISAVYQGIATRWYLAGDPHSTEWAVLSCRKAILGIMQQASSVNSRRKPGLRGEAKKAKNTRR